MLIKSIIISLLRASSYGGFGVANTLSKLDPGSGHAREIGSTLTSKDSNFLKPYRTCITGIQSEFCRMKVTGSRLQRSFDSWLFLRQDTSIYYFKAIMKKGEMFLGVLHYLLWRSIHKHFSNEFIVQSVAIFLPYYWIEYKIGDILFNKMR